MKKIYVSFLLLANLLMTAQVLAATTFENKFSNCSRYVSDNGKQIVAVLGWINRKCYYMEATSKQKIDCGFTFGEHEALTKALKQNKGSYTNLTSFDGFTQYLQNASSETVSNPEEQGNTKASTCTVVNYSENLN